MLDVVGGTPVVQLADVVPDHAADVFVKLEWFNPTGSYKDRMALAMIEEAEPRGELRPGMSVVEYTAGSTGSSLAYVCAVKGYRFRVVSSDAFAAEKLKTMAAFGAELTLIESDGGAITPELISRVIDKAREYALEPGTYWTNQLHNVDSPVGYREVGRELLEQMDRSIDWFCASVGTAGLAMGVAGALDEGGSDARVAVFEPASSQGCGRAGYSNGPSGQPSTRWWARRARWPLLGRRAVTRVGRAQSSCRRSRPAVAALRMAKATAWRAFSSMNGAAAPSTP